MATSETTTAPEAIKETPAPGPSDLTPAEVAELRTRLATAELRIDALQACGPSANADWQGCLTRELTARGIPAETPAESVKTGVVTEPKVTAEAAKAEA